MNILDQYAMQDPRYQYSAPHPEPDSSQPDPALDALLKPQADHGEKTYRGAQRSKDYLSHYD